MVYIVSTILRKMIEDSNVETISSLSMDEVWKRYMLAPEDYS